VPSSAESLDPHYLLDDSGAIPAALISSELARITRSKSFQHSRRHQKLLRHLVEQTVAGNTAALKEPVLAFEVFERRLDAFDPARDTIVRVEARRLRQRLDRYYGNEGSDAALEIRLPVGSYVPTLRRRDGANVGDAETRRAKDLVERGDHFLRQPLSRFTLEEARTRFEDALRESPAYAPALVGLGRACYNLATGWYCAPRPAAEHAAEALRRALTVDANNATAHALLGAVIHQFEYDWETAHDSLRRAVALAPTRAFVHSAYGYNLLARDELDAADRELTLARRLDPQYVNARIHMVNLRIAQRRIAHAEAELEAMLDVAPDSMPAAGVAGLLAMIRGDAEAALRHYQRACDLAPDHPNAFACFAAAQGFAGRVDLADATIARMHVRFGENCVSPYVLAIVATRCGRADAAFALLEDAVDVRDPNVLMMASDPSFDSLHADARWPRASAKPVPGGEAQ